MGLIIKALQHPVLIAYLSGANNYSIVHFRTGEQLMISKSLRFLEKQLPEFVRIHKTILLNPNCIKKIHSQAYPKSGGSVLIEDGTTLPISRRQWPLLAQHVWTEELPLVEPERSVAFISSDTTKSLLLRQLVNDQWPSVLLHVMESGAFLTQLIALAEANRPALVLIDLRQATPSRLALLRELKETPRLRRLPVVVLIAPNSGSTRPGYVLQANSVVVIPDDNVQFVQTMEQVCRYWLTMASIPQI